ncbi:glycosyl transferase [Thermaurantimonas aggregans]|uniref:Glycosyl transferase n=1 Tax=Thermaurantimonas aggregans TaxID=2173829 RepID=A0A401XJX6_9FLAO|nr:sugar transferase [Thermaurantimonas aggregans]GCD77335.1 glycosyl transferase [Thermaurantimonas aggregans]
MNVIVKRFFDIIFSLIALCVLLIPMFIIGILIKLDSKGSVFFVQDRIGRNFKKFKLYKFRTMVDSQKASSGLFEPGNTKRVTRIGKFLRKYKLDELPQLFNVLKGEMSLVGPRPEVEKWTNAYPDLWKKILQVKPGITDYASIKFRNEEEILKNSKEREKTYKDEILPEKLQLNLAYVNEGNVVTDIKILLLTIFKIFK